MVVVVVEEVEVQRKMCAGGKVNGWGGLPTKDTAQDGSVEALGRAETALHLRYHHFVFGVIGQEGEATRHGAEGVRGRHVS